MAAASCQHFFAVRDYDLSATLCSGQVFRWRPCNGPAKQGASCVRAPATAPGRGGAMFGPSAAGLAGSSLGRPTRAAPRDIRSWEGVVGSRWVRLRPTTDGLLAETARPVTEWRWLADYLQTDVDLDAVLAGFPDDPPMRAAVAACRGVRLLRQNPWECLASFILSSTKQIVHIQQIIAVLCRRFGEPVAVPPGHEPEFTFPGADRLAECSEAELRTCRMGFRAPYLRQAARAVAEGALRLDSLRALPLEEARRHLLRLPGVGEKIANCVLLFALGFPTAFPVDVWVERALRRLYFPGRRPAPRQLREFAATHFGPHAGYAQQYLFHYVRRTMKR